MHNKTGIEYLDYTWPIFSGCENWHNGICGGGGQDFECWAKRLVEGRLRRFYPYGFAPTFYPVRLENPIRHKKPAVIGVSFMGDLFGDWETATWHNSGFSNSMFEGKPVSMYMVRLQIFNIVKACRRHTFVFLTKCPWNLARWNPWPENAWVGASATNKSQFQDAVGHLPLVQAKVHFISFEPLLERMNINRPYGLEGIQWVIIGGKSGKGKSYPEESWIQEIEAEADRVGAKVFEKDNLRKVWEKPRRRELP